MVIDIYEFHPYNAFERSVNVLIENQKYSCVRMSNTFLKHQLFIIGGYYDIPHHRYFRIRSKVRYCKNHNFPEDLSGEMLNGSVAKFTRNISFKQDVPLWNDYFIYHMGFAKNEENMSDKTQYYLNRGERSYRPKTTHSRAAWFDESQMPKECKVFDFDQPIINVLSGY